MHPISLKNVAILATVSLWLTLPAAAQRSEQPNRQRDADQQRQGQQDSRNRSQDSRSSSQRSRQLHLDPLGQIVIGIDSDGDRRFESVEAINYYDLQLARKQSAQRRARSDQQGNRGPQQASRGRTTDAQGDSSRSMRGGQRQPTRQRESQRPQASQQMAKVSGTVTELKTIRMVDGPKHRVAKIETKKGDRIPVDLGRVEQVEQFDLQDGDQITVYGKHTRINDKRMVSAQKVQAGDKTMKIGRERDRDLKRVQGEITKMFTRRFRGRDQQFDVAKVELMGGRTETIILGPADRLRDLDLQEGDTVQLLVRRGRYNDAPALIADQVRSGDRTVRVAEPEGRRFTMQQSRQQK